MKMDKPRDFEYNLIKEGNAHEVQSRGINAGHEVLQILADASELKKKRGGENRACQGRRTSAFWVRTRSGGVEFKENILRLVNVERAVTNASGEKYPE